MGQHESKVGPTRPYKAYAGILAAIITSILASEAPLNIWVKVIGAALLAGIAVYMTPNPLKTKIEATNGNGDLYLGE